MSDKFFQVEQKTYPTSQGKVELPILYYDVSVFQAFFKADADGAWKLLAGTGLRPVIQSGAALVGFACFEYRKTSIGPYNEVGVCIATYPETEKTQPSMLADMLRPSWGRKIGFHVIDLPVSTEAANSAGRELWGYPKFVTEIPLRFSAGAFEGAVLEPGKTSPIATLAGSYGLGVPFPAFDLVLYSHKEGVMLKTVVDVDSRMTTALGKGLTLKVGPSEHRMAKNLRSLGLDGASPAAMQVTAKFRSRLHAGRPVSELAFNA